MVSTYSALKMLDHFCFISPDKTNMDTFYDVFRTKFEILISKDMRDALYLYLYQDVMLVIFITQP